MNYDWFLRFVPDARVRTIFELGSRDCLDAVALARAFGAEVYAFECNPDGLVECERTLAQHPGVPVKLVPLAVSDETGPVAFYPFDRARYDNIGASSLFQVDFRGGGRTPDDPDFGRGEVQTKIVVQATRLDDFCRDRGIGPVDLVCMDLQGAELKALLGFGDALRTVSHVVCEVSLRSTYVGGCSFQEVYVYLAGQGFRYRASNAFGEALPPAPYQVAGLCEFNALFSRT